MPWWAISYLVILTVVVFISIIKDYYDKRSTGYMLGEFASGALGFVFILSYWMESIANLISWGIIPLLIYTIAWDQYALSKMQRADYADLTEQENLDMDRYSKVFAMLFISPCYIAGILVAYKQLSP